MIRAVAVVVVLKPVLTITVVVDLSILSLVRIGVVTVQSWRNILGEQGEFMQLS
jgi:hypothetical protein